MPVVLVNSGGQFCRMVINKKNKTRVIASNSRKYTVGIAICQRVDVVQLTSTDKIALEISARHNFRTG